MVLSVAQLGEKMMSVTSSETNPLSQPSYFVASFQAPGESPVTVQRKRPLL